MVQSGTMAASVEGCEVVYLIEARASPTCFPSDPPTVTDHASALRWGPGYAATSCCQARSLMAAVLSFVSAAP